ncbi:hypothetical protein [Streptomyces fulvoviolaceus]|uniref:hypothetical protein n=1 Tax=Streptomyces fulvoviolaceus TaxID=285535 RepID=UPI0004CA0840|nr:hypothetical protein [Streptomyces fulvoviolaceus]
MKKLARKRLHFPMAIAAAAATVALAASPASAATININIASQVVPSGAGCVYATDSSTGSIVGPVQFTSGSTVVISGINVEPLDTVHFDWYDSGCSRSVLANDRHQVPSDISGGVWNVN